MGAFPCILTRVNRGLSTTEKLSIYGTAEIMNVAKDFATFGALILVPDTLASFDKFAGWTE